MYSSLKEMYTSGMEVTATNLRKNLFSSLEKAIAGEPVTVVYKGVPLTITTRPKGSKLARAKRQYSLVGSSSIAGAKKKLLAQMEKAWEEDWKDL